MPLTKEEQFELAIENVKTAKRELKHCLSAEGLQMKGWGKAAAYSTILALIVENCTGTDIFKTVEEE